MTRIPLHTQIAIAMALAVLLGMVADADTVIFGVKLLTPLEFLGALFLKALRMLVVPLVTSSILIGILGLEGHTGIGKLGIKSVLYYGTTSVCATAIGVLVSAVIEPGRVGGKPAQHLLGLASTSGEALSKMQTGELTDISKVLLRLLPENPIMAAAQGDMMGLIIFCLLFGYLGTKIDPEPRRVMTQFWAAVNAIVLKMAEVVIWIAPLGVFGLVAKVALLSKADALIPLLSFVLTVVIGLLLHVFVVLCSALFFVGRISPLAFIRHMAPALTMALSTASSAATLPLSMQRLRTFGVSERVLGFTIPLGSTINMDGTALYECMAAVFIAQAYGLNLGLAQLFIVLLIALLTSVGMAGIPAASLVAISVILGALGLPLEGIGLILAVDRVLDMLRTAVNVFSDACGTAVIAASEGDQLGEGSAPSPAA